MPAKKKLRKPSGGAGRPKKGENLDLREDLILAGEKLLQSNSLEEFSLRKVAAIAGVSHVATYHYFENKNSLLAAIAERGFQKYFSDFEEEVQNTTGDFYDRFISLGWTYINFHIENRQYARIMFGGGGLELSSQKELRAVSRKTYKQLREIISTGQREGKISSGNSREKTLAAWAMIHGIAMLILEKRLNPGKSKSEIRKFVHSVTEYAYAGMRGSG